MVYAILAPVYYWNCHLKRLWLGVAESLRGKRVIYQISYSIKSMKNLFVLQLLAFPRPYCGVALGRVSNLWAASKGTIEIFFQNKMSFSFQFLYQEFKKNIFD